MKSTLDRALNILNYKDRTTGELRAKLREKDCPEAEIKETIAQLCATGVLDDARWTENWLLTMSRLRPCSLRQSAFQLQKKGIAPELVEQKWHDLELDEAALAQSAAAKKLKILSKSDPKTRDKLARHLAGRGFGWSIIQQILRENDIL